MTNNVLYIKNMVCPRCIKVVSDELSALGINILHIKLGSVTLESPLSEQEYHSVKIALENNGFQLIDDKKSRIIDAIKTVIIEKIHHSAEEIDFKNSSDYIAGELGYDYSYLSSLFSSVEGITIEKYMINQKIERVKELLVYDELTISEIAYQLGYSSVQHLSAQFKKVTGLTPSHFKNLKENTRKPLDSI